jgi:hypothetical protein
VSKKKTKNIMLFAGFSVLLTLVVYPVLKITVIGGGGTHKEAYELATLGVTDRLGVPGNKLHFCSFEQADITDDTVAGRPRYTVNGWVNVSDSSGKSERLTFTVVLEYTSPRSKESRFISVDIK